MKKNAIVYIDGYNWYHGIFKHYPEWKWLNLESFFTTLRSDEEILAVKMFTTWIDHDTDAKERQERYFNALKTLPKVRLIFGVFQSRQVTCRGTCQEKYFVPEEKKTDVNLAVEMIDDALNNRCERMFVVSGDSDIQPAVEWVAKHRSDIKVTVFVPAIPAEQPYRRTDYYRTTGLKVECRFLPLGNLADHQFPNYVKLADGKLAIRPHLWKKSASP